MSVTELPLEDVPCDLCGAHDEQFLYEKAGHLTGHPFRLVRCRGCGLLYFNPRLKAEALAALYDERYYAGRGFDEGVSYAQEVGQETDEEKKFRPMETARALAELAPPPARTLDYGCGLGDLMQQASRCGFTAEGFEVSRYAAEFGRSQGLTIYSDPADIPTDSYDLVSAIEVLEHCYSPLDALRRICRSLKPGGVFYYTTGSFDGFWEAWKRKGRGADNGYVLPEGHIYFFSRPVMKAYLAKAGFSEVFDYETPLYEKGTRSYKVLARLGIANDRRDRPANGLEAALYRTGRVAGRMLSGQKLLPLARR